MNKTTLTQQTVMCLATLVEKLVTSSATLNFVEFVEFTVLHMKNLMYFNKMCFCPSWPCTITGEVLSKIGKCAKNQRC